MRGLLRLAGNLRRGAAGLLAAPGGVPLSLLRRNRVVVHGRGNTVLVRGHGRGITGCSFEFHGDGNRVVIGSRASISNARFYFRGSRHALTIAPEVWIGGGSFWFEDDGCRIEIGRGTSIQDAHLAAIEPGSAIVLGEDCMLGSDIDVRTGDSHSMLAVASGERTNAAGDVTIADHVWIAAHCRILKGVAIGRESVVGTGAVVTGPMPANCMAAGVPARVVKTGITWARERIPPPGSALPADGLPELGRAWLDRGEALRRAGRLEEALDAFDRAAGLAPGDARARHLRGVVRLGLGNLAEALADFEAAARLRPGVAWYWFDRGLALRDLGRHAESVRSLRRAVRRDGDYPAAWHALAGCYAELGDVRLARRSARRAAELDPERYGEESTR